MDITLFSYSPIEGHLSYFQFLVIKKCCYQHLCTGFCVNMVFISLWWIQRNGILRNCYTRFSRRWNCFAFIPEMCESSSCSTASPTLCSQFFFFYAFLKMCLFHRFPLPLYTGFFLSWPLYLILLFTYILILSIQLQISVELLLCARHCLGTLDIARDKEEKFL